MATQKALATAFRNLHIPGKPLVLTNVYDAVTARAIATLPQTKALATSSAAVATVAGMTDDDLTFEVNLRAVKAIASVAKEFNLPVTVDFQDGYGDELKASFTALLGVENVVGINLEDYDKAAQKLIPLEVATERVKTVLEIAKNHGVEDFVVNARTDVFLHGGSMTDAIERGKAYLAVGATTVFAVGGSGKGGASRKDVEELSAAFNGNLNAGFRRSAGGLTVKELSDIGVARVSMGPALQFVAMKAFAAEAQSILEGN